MQITMVVVVGGGEVMAAGQKKLKMEIMGKNGKREEKRRKIA